MLPIIRGGPRAGLHVLLGSTSNRSTTTSNSPRSAVFMILHVIMDMARGLLQRLWLGWSGFMLLLVSFLCVFLFGRSTLVFLSFCQSN